MNKPLSELSDGELISEYNLWNNKVKNATAWGAALAAADEFRKECWHEMQRRGLEVNDE
jgi:hypothetical protein